MTLLDVLEDAVREEMNKKRYLFVAHLVKIAQPVHDAVWLQYPTDITEGGES
jgi:hypothetical protein